MANTKGPMPGQKRMSFANLGLTRGGLSLEGPAVMAALVVAQGTFNANGAIEVVVPATSVTADSIIWITIKTPGGTVPVSPPNVISKTAGVGFSIKSTALDTSIYSFVVVG